MEAFYSLGGSSSWDRNFKLGWTIFYLLLKNCFDVGKLQ
jgi:hypothetical protein